jgi:3'-5' exoribonuclease
MAAIRKKQFIKDFKKDDIISDVFVVKFKKPVEQYKNGYKFELRIGDSSKEIMYKYWGPADEVAVQGLYDSIRKDDVVFAQGRVNEWNGSLEISANGQYQLSVLKSGEYDIQDFIRRSAKDKELMWSELEGFIDSIKNPAISSVVNYFFKDRKFQEQFKECPAAMFIHHGWLSGLLEHTLDVVKISDFVCKIHPTLDRDLVISGALFHDMGKIEEFEVRTSINVSNEGMLIGHVSIAAEKLAKAMDALGTDKRIRMKIIHMMLTHMGEYGSNKKPSFPEALAVYHADHTNGDMQHMLTLKEDASTEDDYIYNKDFGNIYLR